MKPRKADAVAQHTIGMLSIPTGRFLIVVSVTFEIEL
jgi:hypothetical protein